jgi:hypothetical protein
MSPNVRAVIVWLYIIVTLVTFLAIAAITIFEAHVRWSLNQNFSLLDPGALASLVVLFAVQMLGLVWLSKPH